MAVGIVVSDELKKGGVLFATAGVVMGLGALSMPVLFPQVDSIVIDEVAGEVALETRWLCWEERDTIEVADIDRIQHRTLNLWLGQQCLDFITVHVIANDRTSIATPKGLRTKAMAALIASVAHATPGQIETVTNDTC
jgi:hypothetical protein